MLAGRCLARVSCASGRDAEGSHLDWIPESVGYEFKAGLRGLRGKAKSLPRINWTFSSKIPTGILSPSLEMLSCF